MRAIQSRRACGILGLLLAGSMLTGCEEAVRNEFRTAAATSLQSGLSAILDGIVDGIFAVIEPDETTTDTTGGETTAA